MKWFQKLFGSQSPPDHVTTGNAKNDDQQMTDIQEAKRVAERAKACYENGDFDGAIHFYDQILSATHSIHSINPFMVRELRAQAYCKAGRFPEAEQEFEELLAVTGGIDASMTYWLLLARNKGDEDKAWSQFEVVRGLPHRKRS